MIFDKNKQGAKFIISYLLITYCLFTKSSVAARDRGARCEKPDYIPNGSYRLRRDRVMRITCNSGFLLQGPKTIDCIRGKWDGEKPVCAKKGCKKDLGQPENGRIQIENDVKAILYCSDSFNLAGNRHSYCNGSQWDRPIGNCRERKNVVQHVCDFETDDICGWTYEPREGLEWKRVMAANVFTTFKTGPRHDHTTLTANGGHYMLMESLTRLNDDVTLTSPIYDRGLSLKTACCFQFYYFMYGAGVGDLFVVVKPVSLDLDNLLKNHKDLIKFQKYGNQNNIWNEAHFNIEELDEDFQILFVAKSGRGQLSDIAIDDVKLLTGDECRALDSKDEEEMSNEEYDSTTYESIFEMQSCAGRCFDTSGNGLIRTFNHLKRLCNCDTDCEDNETCCPDFRTACLSELFAQSTPTSEAFETTQRNEMRKNDANTTQATTTIITTKTTLIKSTPTTTATTTSTAKLMQIIARTKLTTIKVTPTTTTTTASFTGTSTKSSIITTTTAASRVTAPTTTPRMVTSPTTTTATTARRTEATTKTAETTPTTTVSKTTAKKNQETTTTLKTTAFTEALLTKANNTILSTTTRAIPDLTSTRRTIHSSKSIEYIINDKLKTDKANRESSSLLLYVFFIFVILIMTGAVYKRFGDKAVAWYMIRFRQNGGDEDSSSITTRFNRPQTKAESIDRRLKTTWRHKIKKSTTVKNSMQSPLVNEDDEDDVDDIGANEHISLKNNIYTEL